MNASRTRRVMVACLLMSVAMQLFAQEKPAAPGRTYTLGTAIPINPDVRTGVLPNGLTWYVLKNGKPEKRAELRLAVNVGSVQERDEQQGLAHFCEHMAFNGTSHFKKDELVRYLELLGTRFGNDLNAYTSFDETVYMLQIPTDKPGLLETGMQVIEDWAHNVSLDGDQIDKERGVIIEEMRSRKGAGMRIMEKQYPVMFHGSKYADRLPIGKENILTSFEHETLRSFYREWYRPDNMAVIAVGDFDVAIVEEMIKEHFGRMTKPASALQRPEIPVPDHTETLFSIVADPEAPGAMVEVMSKRPPRREKKIVDLRNTMMNSLYEQMFNARTQELTQKADPPFVYGYGYYSPIARTKDALHLAAQVENSGVTRGLDALLTEALRANKHGFAVTELERAKTSMLRRYEERFKERDKTPSDRFADELVRSFLSGEPAPGVEIEYEIAKKYVPSIKVGEVNEYAASLSFDKNQVVTVSLPEKVGVSVPTEKELAAIFTAVRGKSIEPYVDEVANKPLAEVPASSISIKETKEVKELGLTIWTLSNGIRVVIKPTDFKNDEILFAAYSPGGLSVLHDSVYVSASKAADIVNESGIGEFDNTQLEKLLVGKIANVSPTLSDLEEGFQGNAAPKDLETMFQMLYLYFAHPRKDTIAFQSMMKRMKTMYEGMSAYPEMVFFDSVTAVLTQRHFRGRRMNEKLLGEVSLDVAFRQYQNRFSDASDYTMFFVGNITPEALQPLALKYLGALPTTGRKETWRDVGMRMPEGAVEKTVFKGIEKKSMVALAFNGPFEWTVQNRYNMAALKELLTIKLREAVREEKGGTYGVQVSFEPTKYPRSEYQAAVIFGCNPDRVDELISTAVEVMKDVVAKGASDEDVKKIQEIQRREFEKSQKENGFWSGSLKFYFSNGDDPLSLLGYLSRVDALTSKAIQEAAARYLTFDHMKKFVLRPEQK